MGLSDEPRARSQTAPSVSTDCLFVVLLPLFLVFFSAQVEIGLNVHRSAFRARRSAFLGLVVMLWGCGISGGAAEACR